MQSKNEVKEVEALDALASGLISISSKLPYQVQVK